MGHGRGKSKTIQRPFGDQLPNLPSLDLEQDNIPLNPPNQPQDLPAGEENQQHQAEEPNQVPNLSPEPEELGQLEQPNLSPKQPNQPNQPLIQFKLCQQLWHTHNS